MGKSRLYTGGGDKGKTSLVGGVKVSKTHPRIEAYGTLDELNAFLGLLICAIDNISEKSILQSVQHHLFAIGSYLATDTKETCLEIKSGITQETILQLEETIDQIDNDLPKLKGFVLPGGCTSASLAHVCRTVCRRAERQIYRLSESVFIDALVLVFMNRLSDLLFVIARNECKLKNKEEIIWQNVLV